MTQPLHVPPYRAMFVHANEDGGLVIGIGKDLYSAIVETTRCPTCHKGVKDRCVAPDGERSGRVHVARFHRFWEGDDPTAFLDEPDA